MLKFLSFMVAILFASSIFAAPVVWTVPATTMTGGSVISGTFTYDAAIPAMTAVNLTSTGPVAATYTFVGSFVAGTFAFGQSAAVAVNGASTIAVIITGIPATAGPYTLPRIVVGGCLAIAAGLCTNQTVGEQAFNVVLNSPAPVVASTTSVPTLSEYALMALASLMAMLGLWQVRKRSLK